MDPERAFTNQVNERRGGLPPHEAAAGKAGKAEGTYGDAQEKDG